MKIGKINLYLFFVCFVNILSLVGQWFCVDCTEKGGICGILTKPITSVCFLLSSLMFYFLLNKPKTNKCIARSCAIFVFLILSVSLTLQFIDNNLFSVFLKNESENVLTVSHKTPSIMTCLSLYLISYFGLEKTRCSVSNFISKSLTAISILAIIGYIFKKDLFYYHIPEISCAMSIITAFSILLLSLITRQESTLNNSTEN